MSDEFVMFVRPVSGFAVPRYGTPEFIGAKRSSVEEQKKGAPAITWDADTIVPLHRRFVDRCRKELGQHLRAKELVECSRAEWEAQNSRKPPAGADGAPSTSEES